MSFLSRVLGKIKKKVGPILQKSASVLKSALDITSFVPGPVGAVSRVARAGLEVAVPTKMKEKEELPFVSGTRVQRRRAGAISKGFRDQLKREKQEKLARKTKLLKESGKLIGSIINQRARPIRSAIGVQERDIKPKKKPRILSKKIAKPKKIAKSKKKVKAKPKKKVKSKSKAKSKVKPKKKKKKKKNK